MNNKKIVLVGMMGSGKSAVARKLSQMLNIELFEADEIFEQQNNCLIKDFFKNFGEEKFRQIETEILKKILKKENFILSTGGGAVLAQENRKILFNEQNFSIYLMTNPKTIFNRIKTDKTRPLLLVDNPKQEIEKILSKREEFYSQAKLKIQTDNKTIEKIAEEIINYGNN